MNPGKVVDPYRMSPRISASAPIIQPWEPPTAFPVAGTIAGSFAHAALAVRGRRQVPAEHARKNPDDDTMCPSYHGDARRAARDPRTGTPPLGDAATARSSPEGWRDGQCEAVRESLDLCLACKGCKGDCPVNVDMATYKAEFLSHYYEGRLRPRSGVCISAGSIKWARTRVRCALGSSILFTQLAGAKQPGEEGWLPAYRNGRTIPAFAAGEHSNTWFGATSRTPQVREWAAGWSCGPIPSTTTSHPRRLRPRLKVSGSTPGIDVVVPEQHLCCGSVHLYDHGFLGIAPRVLPHPAFLWRRSSLLKSKRATPVVVLEPSCCSVFRDELNGLMPDSAARSTRLKEIGTIARSRSSCEFLCHQDPAISAPRLKRKAIVQGHCHHKAIMRLDAEEEVMTKMALDFQIARLRLLRDGRRVSATRQGTSTRSRSRVAERALLALPFARPTHQPSIIADGFSCKGQIEQGTHAPCAASR
jgi:Fe-S oxidoreductase